MPRAVIDLIVSWAPLLLFFGVLIFFVRRGGMHARAPSGHTMIELYELQLDEMKRNAAALERIAQALERRGG